MIFCECQYASLRFLLHHPGLLHPHYSINISHCLSEFRHIIKKVYNGLKETDIGFKVTTSGRAGGLKYEPLKADCFKPPKGRPPGIKLTDQSVDLQILDV